MMPKLYDASYITEEVLTPEEYIELYNNRRNDIKDAEPILPKLGSKGYGSIKVIYKNPQYKIKKIARNF